MHDAGTAAPPTSHEAHIDSIQGSPSRGPFLVGFSALVQRRKYDITVRCKKDGFLEATYINNSGLASGAVAGNVAADLLLTAGLSSIVDSASGADNQYDSAVNITMIPMSAAAANAVVPAPTASSAPVTVMSKPVND